MLKENGELDLKKFTLDSYKKTITQVTSKVWHVLGYGHSNAIFIEGNTSVILIDTLDTFERGEKLLNIIEKKTGKPVKTIIYTHSHPDHRGGAGAFMNTSPEIIAFSPAAPLLQGTEILQDIQNLRGNRQFGYSLNDEENISQGIGVREGIPYGERRAFVNPTTLYNESKVVREIDGIKIEMVRLPGEAEDQIMIWLPDEKVLCCGDNYYGCWPNLYAIRGGQYRDIAVWLDSIKIILSYQAEHLLSGHTRVISGKDEVKKVLTNFHGAINYVLQKTLEGMNKGKSIDALASEIKLPEEYASLPYLKEHYGSIDWTVRSIYTAYLGWFDGNPTKLHPLSPKEHAHKAIKMMGGSENILKEINEAFKRKEYQWCLELCDLLIDGEEEIKEAYAQKSKALIEISKLETSANGRHYYIAYAHEIKNIY